MGESRIIAIANRNNLGKHTTDIQKALEDRLGAEVIITESVEETQDKMPDEFSDLIAVGGDGTINSVYNAGIKKNKEFLFGVVPFGNGNDFAASMGFQSLKQLYTRQEQRRHEALVRSLKHIAWTINNPDKRGFIYDIDVGQFTINYQEVNHFLSYIGTGLLANTAEKLNKQTKGKKRYSLAAAKELGKQKLKTNKTYANISYGRKPGEIIINLNHTKPEEINSQSRRFTSFEIMNNLQFGGGMVYNPKGDMNDGFFEAIGIYEVGLIGGLLGLNKVAKGSDFHLKDDRFGFDRQIVKATIKTDKDITIHFDGETTIQEQYQDLEVTVGHKQKIITGRYFHR